MRITKLSDTRYHYNDKLNAFVRQARYNSKSKALKAFAGNRRSQYAGVLMINTNASYILMHLGNNIFRRVHLPDNSLGNIRRWYTNTITKKNKIGYYTFNRKDIYQPISQYKDIFI